MFTEGNSLPMKVGLIIMSLTLALLITAVVVSVTLGSEFEWVVAAEVATKSPGQAPRYPSGEEESATKNSSSKKEFSRSSSGEKSLRYGSSSSFGGSLEQRKEEAKVPQAVLQQEAETSQSQSPTPQLADQQTPSRAPSDPESHPQ